MAVGKYLVKMVINIVRDEVRELCQFGDIILNGIRYCYSLENAELLIPLGEYNGIIYVSPHLNYKVILLENVPGREFIEIHKANWPRQLKGCISPGLGLLNDGVSQSKIAFDYIMGLAEVATKIEVIME